jgi:hypothetical protein
MTRQLGLLPPPPRVDRKNPVALVQPMVGAFRLVFFLKEWRGHT